MTSFKFCLSSAISRFTLALLMLCSLCINAFASSEAPHSIAGARTVQAYEAKQLYDDGALFLDVRSIEEWEMGHVDGAIHLDLSSGFETLFRASADQKDTPIVIYCNSAESLRGAFASAVSVQWGFTNVYFYRNGYYSWMAKDFPTYLGYSEQARRDFQTLKVSDQLR